MLKKLFFIISALCTHISHSHAFDYLFCHGVGGNAEQVRYYQMFGLLPKNTTSFNFNDWHTNRFDRTKTALGQENDITILRIAYNKLILSKNNIILYGVSRGAATIINFVGQSNPPNIAALILESPYAHVNAVVDHLRKFLFFLRLLPRTTIVRLIYRLYNPNGAQPIDYIKKCPNIPIAFICSKADQLIPYQTTITLYNTLIAQGRTNVHLLILEEGAHANLANQQEYQRFISIFLKKYNLTRIR